jgi:hypothetical protein
MTEESLTYSELGERLGSSPEAARSLARRLRLARKPGDDGKVRITVDLAEIQYSPAPRRSPDGPRADIDTLTAQIEQLQSTSPNSKRKSTVLRPMRLNTGADFERERDRCDRLVAETLVLNKVAMTAREAAARLEGEALGRRNRRRWWGWLVTPGRKHQRAGTLAPEVRPQPLPAISVVAVVVP